MEILSFRYILSIWYDTDRNENTAFKGSIVVCKFFAVRSCLENRRLSAENQEYSIKETGLENREYGRRDPSCWPRGTLYPHKLALTSPTSGSRSVGIVL
jgi:hypothetical protein